MYESIDFDNAVNASIVCVNIVCVFKIRLWHLNNAQIDDIRPKMCLENTPPHFLHQKINNSRANKDI